MSEPIYEDVTPMIFGSLPITEYALPTDETSTEAMTSIEAMTEYCATPICCEYGGTLHVEFHPVVDRSGNITIEGYIIPVGTYKEINGRVYKNTGCDGRVVRVEVCDKDTWNAKSFPIASLTEEGKQFWGWGDEVLKFKPGTPLPCRIQDPYTKDLFIVSYDGQMIQIRCNGKDAKWNYTVNTVLCDDGKVQLSKLTRYRRM